MKYFFTLSLFISSVFIAPKLYAQGCSDAGFCTIDALKPGLKEGEMKFKNQFKAGVNFGKADNDITVIGQYFEYNRKLSNKWNIDARLTALAQSGNDINVFGLSDFYVNASYSSCSKIKIIGGFKIPLMDGDKQKNNSSLPMDYQSSLGTFDLITGVAIDVKGFKIVAALQQPLTQNKNSFFNEVYIPESPLREFQTTNDYNRKGDVLLRLTRAFALNKKFTLTPGLLPIYHLGNDSYTSSLNEKVTIEGSKGLTFNGNIFIDYAINNSSYFQLSVGAPFVRRDSRPDGLTRSFVMNAEYRFRF